MLRERSSTTQKQLPGGVSFKILQYLHANTCIGVSFLIELHAKAFKFI